ncbi:MAG: DUF5693 family protein [Bacillota bacterium]|nr:DUF5693 family protein [Bacillota bacterium]
MEQGRFWRFFRLLSWAALATGAALSLAVALERHRVEEGYRTVELALDYNGAAALAAQEGLPVEEVLARFRREGVAALGVEEYTLEDAVRLGAASVAQGTDLLAPGGEPFVRGRRLYVGPGPQPGPLWERLERRLPAFGVPYHLRGVTVWEVGEELLAGGEEEEDLRPLLTLGPSAEGLLAARRMGWPVVLRLVNPPRAGQAAGAEDEVQELLSLLPPARPGAAVAFASEEVVGFPGREEEVGRAVTRLGYLVAVTEFSAQRGLAALARGAGSRLVRLHQIAPREMPALEREEAARRLVRAVREREVRLLYLRPFLGGPALQAPLSYNLGYVRLVREGLARAGYRLGPVQPFPALRLGGRPWVLLLLVLGAGSAWLLALRAALLWPPQLEATFWAVAALAGAGMAAAGRLTLYWQLWALGVAVLVPAAAVGVAVRLGGAREAAGSGALSGFERWWRALQGLWCAGAVSLLGGLYLAALLSDFRFLLRVEQFRGVKAALTAPFLLLAAWLALRAAAAGGPGGRKAPTPAQAWQGLWALLRTPVYWWQVGALALLGAVGLIYLLRSGNYRWLPIPPWEQELRRVLEEVLWARPRTKEFLLGHPALLVGLYFWRRQANGSGAGGGEPLRAWLPRLLVLMGLLGQISLLNSFAHLHTPLAVTLVRTVHGLWLGSLVGSAVVALLALAEGVKREKRSGAGEAEKVGERKGPEKAGGEGQ